MKRRSGVFPDPSGTGHVTNEKGEFCALQEAVPRIILVSDASESHSESLEVPMSMRSPARPILVLVCLSFAIAAHAGQRKTTDGSKDRVKAKGTTDRQMVEPGGTMTLKLEVTPDDGIRVYAPGAKSFTGAFVLLSPSKLIKVTKPKYGIPAVEKNPGNRKNVPLYTSAFNIDHVIEIDKEAKPGTEIRIFGALKYQTCDDRVVYPTRTLPVYWTIKVGEPGQ